MSQSLVEMDCGPKCHSKKHALQLLTAVTKGNSRQIQLFLSRCHNVASLRDAYGRTVLHVASSCGKVDTVQWLLTERGADQSVKDIESGWTALHRALFYGQLAAARLLISHGASLEVKDKEGLAPLDILMKDRLPHVSFDPAGVNDVYTWGDNSNYTLGQENEQKRKTAECVELFRRKQLSIKQVVICRYHSTFLTTSGLVYTCGNGHGGRLGHGDQQTCLVPRLVEGLKQEVCVQVSAARDHTMVLTESGTVYSCGLNEHRQLGVLPPPGCCLLPRPVGVKQLRGHHIESVHALRYHSVVHTTDAVFTFGHNAGQLGHQKVPGEQMIPHPRLVSPLNHRDTRIRLVTASDAATVVVTTKGDVFALYTYRCRKVAARCEDIVQVAVTGGHLDSEVISLQEKTGLDLTVLLLSSSHRICIWQSSSPVLRWCSWALRRSLDICQFAVGDASMAFVTLDGDAFLTSVSKIHERNDDLSTARVRKCEKSKVESSQPQKAPGGASGDGPAQNNAFITKGSDALSRQETEEIPVTKLPMVHRATAIALDKKARNFAVLQTQPNASLTEIPLVRDSGMTEDFCHLWEEADITDDIHDVILQIGPNRQQVAAHKFVLASQTEYFRHLFCDDITTDNQMQDSLETTVVVLEDVDYDSFYEILRFIYTGTYQVPTSKISGNQSNPCEHLPNMSHDAVPGKGSLGKVSAYKVYKNQNAEREKSSKVRRSKDSDVVSPLRMLLELASRFGVKQLKKRLEVQCGIRNAAGNNSLSPPTVMFNRRNHQCLYDVCIEAEDHSQIQCHKCVLVARLDYFRSMLGSGWIEASNTKSLSLPVARDVLKVVIDYLYVDSTTVLSDCPSVDLLCGVLTVSDQLLIGRLKDMCEVVLTSLLNLKNACELLQFASVYSAHQLKQSCQQFITINMAGLMETRSLDVLSDDVIDELGIYYRETVPGMCHRVLTPYDGWPDMTYLESLEAELQDVMIDSTASGGRGLVKGVKRSKKRRRTRSSQGDEDPGPERTLSGRLSLSSDPGDIMAEAEEEVREKGLQDVPLTACIEALTICQHGTQADVGRPQKDVSKTTPQKDVSTPRKIVSTTPLKDLINVSSGLRDIIADEERKCGDVSSSNLSSPAPGGSGKKPGRISQKQRKKLAMESPSSLTEEAKDTTSNLQPATNPWGVPQTAAVVKSFKELQLQETDKTEVKTAAERKSFRRLTAGGSTTTWGLSATSGGSKGGEVTSEPDSPLSPVWSAADHMSQTVNTAVSFTEIVQDEQEQKEAWQRAANKPLSLIQIEEQAMQELLLHYRAGAQGDCHVAVERVATSLASPVWAKQQWHGPH